MHDMAAVCDSKSGTIRDAQRRNHAVRIGFTPRREVDSFLKGLFVYLPSPLADVGTRIVRIVRLTSRERRNTKN